MPVKYQPDLSKIDQLRYDLKEARRVINGLYKELTKEQERAECLSSAVQLLNDLLFGMHDLKEAQKVVQDFLKQYENENKRMQ